MPACAIGSWQHLEGFVPVLTAIANGIKSAREMMGAQHPSAAF